MSHQHTIGSFTGCTICGCNSFKPKPGCSTIDSSCINLRRAEQVPDKQRGWWESMIDQEEYNNVIRAAYSICQQIHDMELSGALTFANIQLNGIEPYNMSKPIPKHLVEVLDERSLLYALLMSKHNFPKRFLEGCRNAPSKS